MSDQHDGPHPEHGSPDSDPGNASQQALSTAREEGFKVGKAEGVRVGRLSGLVMAGSVGLVFVALLGWYSVWGIFSTPNRYDLSLGPGAKVMPDRLFADPGDSVVVEATDDPLLFCVFPPKIFGGDEFRIPANDSLELEVRWAGRHSDFRYGLYRQDEKPGCPEWNDVPEHLTRPKPLFWAPEPMDLGDKGEGGGRTGP